MVTEMMPAADVVETLDRHLEQFATDQVTIDALRDHYAEHGYVKLTGLIPPSVFASVKSEVMELLDEHARRIDIHLKATGDTPRYMSTVSEAAISADATLIPQIYADQLLKDVLGQIAGAPVHHCPWKGEEYVIIRQHQVGDTHGWHWGDFSYTVIWIIEAPDPSIGGTLQCVPHTSWDKEDPRVEEYLAANPISNWDNATGDVYFLRSDTTLHRTVPLTQDATRIILNTCWASTEDLEKEQTHETMEAMFQ